MKKFWQELLDYFRGPQAELKKQIRSLEAIIKSLNLSLALLDNHAKLNENRYIKILSGFILQSGGEFILDHAFVEMLDNSKDNFAVEYHLLNPNDPKDLTMYYKVKVTPEDENTAASIEQPYGYDFPEDDGCNYCPDNDCDGGCSN